MQVNSSNQPQLYQLNTQRNKSILEMVQDVQSGNVTGAQAALSQMQQANRALGIDDGTNGTTSLTSTTSPTTTATAGLTGMKADLTAMMSAVQSGDLASAQTAWSQVQSNMAQGAIQPPPPSSFGDSTMDTATDDLTNLLDAVQSGDTDKMKSSATAFSKDLAGILGTSSTSSSTSTGTTDSTSSGNPLIDDLNALIQAAQSGDTTAAQTAQQKLEQDTQATQQASGIPHAHHHHHHGGGGKPPVDASASSAATAATLLSPDATATDPDADTVAAAG